MTKWRPPQWCPFLSFYSIRREDRYKERLNIPFIQWGIFVLILGGEIDGALTPSPHTHTLPCPLLTTQYFHVLPFCSNVHISAWHHICSLWTLWCTLAPYTLLLFLLLVHKFPKCMCNVVHPVFTHSSQFSQLGQKSSRHRDLDSHSRHVWYSCDECFPWRGKTPHQQKSLQLVINCHPLSRIRFLHLKIVQAPS